MLFQINVQALYTRLKQSQSMLPVGSMASQLTWHLSSHVAGAVEPSVTKLFNCSEGRESYEAIVDSSTDLASGCFTFSSTLVKKSTSKL